MRKQIGIFKLIRESGEIRTNRSLLSIERNQYSMSKSWQKCCKTVCKIFFETLHNYFRIAITFWKQKF